MIVSKKELENLYFKAEGIVFAPKTKLIQNQENGKINYSYEILKTAEEVYQEWLENKNKSVIKEPTEQEKLNSQLLKSNLEFQKALTEQKKINANLLLQIQSLQKKEGNK